jgi:hypothetical protein
MYVSLRKARKKVLELKCRRVAQECDCGERSDNGERKKPKARLDSWQSLQTRGFLVLHAVHQYWDNWITGDQSRWPPRQAAFV